jgi:hypothetical protein
MARRLNLFLQARLFGLLGGVGFPAGAPVLWPDGAPLLWPDSAAMFWPHP